MENRELAINSNLAEKGAKISLAVYIILTVFKLVVGYFAHSEALVADGTNNSTDIISTLAIIIGLIISKKPVDDDHPYGHLRAETISSLVSSLIMIAVGFNVLYQAGYNVMHFRTQSPDIISAGVSSICAIVIYIVYRYNKNIAIKVNSFALMAAAKDNLSDAMVGIGTTIGIVASQFGMPWIDPLAAFVVGVLIIKTGWDIFKESSMNLTDGFDKQALDTMSKEISSVDGVNDVKDIKGRIHGNVSLIDVTIVVNPQLNIVEGHNITLSVEEMLNEQFKIKNVFIHVEPDII